MKNEKTSIDCSGCGCAVVIIAWAIAVNAEKIIELLEKIFAH